MMESLILPQNRTRRESEYEMMRETITDRAHGIDVSYIYGLIDPRSNLIRYVGKAKNIKRRLYAHIEKARISTRTHKGRWLSNMQKAGFSPKVIILDIVPDGEWKHYEKLWIRELMDSFKLTNQTSGGDGGSTYMGPRSKEWGEKISKAKTGKPLSPEHREKCKYGWLGKNQSPEMNEKKRISMLGKNSKITSDGLISPDGYVYSTIENLTRFAKKRSLSQSHLWQVLNGQRPSHKGWRRQYNGS